MFVMVVPWLLLLLLLLLMLLLLLLFFPLHPHAAADRNQTC